MAFMDSLKTELSDLHLLKHSFYQAWMAGELELGELQNYVEQYNPFVRAFPCFVSATHSLCEDLSARRYLLENLSEEEGYPNHSSHPVLWQQFAAGLNVSKEKLESAEIGMKARALVELFHKLCRSSYAEGLAALYAYEHQVPEIAKAKIEGLIKNFGVTDEASLSFFRVHETADKFHSETAAKLLEQLSPFEQALAKKAAVKASQALWDFLTEVHGESKSHCAIH